MMNRSERLRAGAAGVAAAAAVFFAGVYVARAMAGGETRRALSFSGTLTGRTGPQSLVFTFRKGTAAVCAPTVTATPDATTGAIAVEIPLGSCPTTLFDGADVTFDVSVGGTVLSPAQPINPVPYAAYADRVGTPDCPNGYERFSETGMPTGAIYCRKGNDEVVRVGAGAAAFWIDRYLDSLWSEPDGAGTQLASGTDAPMAGNGTFAVAVFPASRRGVQSAGNITWMQADALCRRVGKRVPTGREWFAAATGTPGLGTDVLARPADECPAGRGLDYATGSTPQCVSRWGVEQAIGYRRQWGEGHWVDGSSYVGEVFQSRLPPVAGSEYDRGGEMPVAPNPVFGLRCLIPR